MHIPSPQFDAALRVLRTLRDHGHQALFAGGCVRDLLLGREPHDYDVATSATPDTVLALFPRAQAVGAHFGVVVVSCDPPAADSHWTEVATFRADGVYSDGRHPDAVRYTDSAEEDVLRRDFTINGLLLDPLREKEPLPTTKDGCPRSPLSGPGIPQTHPRLEQAPFPAGAVLDYVHGQSDLAAGLIRAIGDPVRRFEEDHLRMLRAVRFAARFGFRIEPETSAAIRTLAPKVHAVSRERLRDELTKMLTEGRARRAFELLDETGLLAELLPVIAQQKGVEQPPEFHPEGDVWTHTLLMLEGLPAGCPMTLAWAVLLHDAGKPATFERAPDRIRFNGHAEVSAAIAADLSRSFRFSNDETRLVTELVANHMRFRDTPRMKLSTLKRFLRMEQIEQHLELHRLDCASSHGGLDNWEFVRQQLAALPPEAVRPTPLLTGHDLRAAGLTPGPLFKVLLHAVEDAQLEGRITTREEALELALRLVSASAR